VRQNNALLLCNFFLERIFAQAIKSLNLAEGAFFLPNALRILAIDDGAFKPKQKGKALLVGVISRQADRIEGILSTSVKVDGLDSTKKIIKMLQESRFKKEVDFLILNGINFAGFNLVDLPLLSKELGIPAIAVLRKKPRMQKIEHALSNFPDKKKRMQLIEKAGEIFKADKVFFQCQGAEPETIKTVLAATVKYSSLPEPLRLAHLIASGISLGESTRP